MPEPMSAERLAEIKAQVERAGVELGEVCSQGVTRRWRMHVPADPRDTDLIISDALKGAEDLLGEVERLMARVAAAEWQMQRSIRETEHGAAVAHLNAYFKALGGAR
jgi:hypothetical protein